MSMRRLVAKNPLFTSLAVGSVTSSSIYGRILEKKAFCASTMTVPSPNMPIISVTMYQYQICPFCNKVKALLDYLKIPYEAVEVNPITKREIKKLGDGTHKKVPVAVINGNTLDESTTIVYKILNELKNNNSSSSSSKGEDVQHDITHKKLKTLMTEDTDKWMTWSEKKLAVMLYPNITRNFEESWAAFEYCGDVDGWSKADQLSNRYLGPLAMYFANGKIKKKYGIVNERQELLDILDEWTNEIAVTQHIGPFLHGAKITMPDLMVFGVIKAISGLPTFTVIMKENNDLKKWYDEVNKLVQG
jgi:microsomal prostaglandin-E synthase 2